MNSNARSLALAVLSVAASASAFYFGTGLHPQWYLTWIAPLPVLLLAARAPLWPALGAAFLSFALGGLNLWDYYREIVPLPAAVFILLVPGLIFAALVFAYRAYVLRGQLIRAALVVPAFWVAGEYLSELQSPHGTFGNLAYTQMDFLPLIQIAAFAGLWGVSFLLFLLPSAVAALTAPASDPKQKLFLALGTGIVFAVVLGFGFQRLHSRPQGAVVIGLLDTDAPGTIFPKGQSAVALIRRYAGQVPSLARHGAQVIVMPEKIGHFDDREVGEADRILGQAARNAHVTLIAGFAHLPDRNEARVYAPDGSFEAAYEKHHLLPGFDAALRPGTTRTLLARPSGRWGLTICKDMDFPALSRQYGADDAGLLLVPAWDFGADGWLHGRMSILRGVESGFSIARSAKQGTLTVSDSRGRVLAEQKTGPAFVSLTASVPEAGEPTFYDRAGDWFAWFDLALAAAVVLPWKNKAKRV